MLCDGNGGYAWVDPDDPRLAEVRLLGETGRVGDVTGGPRDNLLIQGDCRDALRALTHIPEWAAAYRGAAKLVYLDPPFNTGQTFAQYDDGLDHSIWLAMMRERLLLARDLLAPDGSLWVHLDDAESAYCKVLLDEIFGRPAFVGTVVWEKDRGRRNDTDLSSAHDYIHVYAPSGPGWRSVRNLLPRTALVDGRYRNPDGDPRGPWLQGDNGTAKSGSERNRFAVELPSGRVVRPPAGSYWRFSPATLDRARAEGRVWFGRTGDSLPVIKRYRHEVQPGLVPRTWWPADEVGTNQDAKRDHLRRLFPGAEPFATPKPEPLLRRIIEIATGPGDLVVDAFAGSGTTAAVAHKLGRRWVAVEQSAATVAAFTLPRLRMVVDGTDPGGVTRDEAVSPAEPLPDGVTPADVVAARRTVTALAGHGLLDGVGADALGVLHRRLGLASRTRRTVVREWPGGGGFRALAVSPARYRLSGGRLLLETLPPEFVAAQLGFRVLPHGPFSGVRGRTRLAVADGVVDDRVAADAVAALRPDETVTIVGRAVLPGTATLLRALRPGSRVLKAPDDLLRHRRVVR
ncbi:MULTISPECIES: site-specific DNA-methyltransferase [Catenuloplanes]|uniref:Adenine-specific DNA-methyltransferase n=1 Tax=Catenuloplanes niger TaxID=587534 RepID=A0AAE3ZT16_9ACTN|nr:site-specific DNA-methyltransferase [Catenuloplanes niger]MDR7325327.1 adenine-specific DNA-methyltransferase [Catenuloplanes niger]